MTNDLISRETVLEALRARGRELLKLGTSFEANIASVTALECVNIVKDAPAVDAVPVVHGRWYQCKLNVPKGRGQTYLVWGCSNCHKHERKRSDYCPNCGARMDKGET